MQVKGFLVVLSRFFMWSFAKSSILSIFSFINRRVAPEILHIALLTSSALSTFFFFYPTITMALPNVPARACVSAAIRSSHMTCHIPYIRTPELGCACSCALRASPFGGRMLRRCHIYVAWSRHGQPCAASRRCGSPAPSCKFCTFTCAVLKININMLKMDPNIK